MTRFNVHISKLNGDGTEAIGDCPFCGNEDHLYIKLTNGLWFCHHCGKGGNLTSCLEMLLPTFQMSFRVLPAIHLAKNRNLKLKTLREVGIVRFVIRLKMTKTVMFLSTQRSSWKVHHTETHH